MNPMNPMGTPSYNLGPPLWHPPPPPPVPPFPLHSATYWTAPNVRCSLKELYSTIKLANAMQKELEMFTWIKEREGSSVDGCELNGVKSIDHFTRIMADNQIDIKLQESMSLRAANEIMSKLRFQLEPFRIVTDEQSPWEEKSAVKRLADKMNKNRRNKLWQRRKRKRIAENLAKEREQFDRKDKEADEWMIREIAKNIAQNKVEKMKEIAKLKSIEEKKKLESELELVLIVEKLQELRSIRIQKLKKQGHFLPEEDDKFLEQVRAAVEEEERQTMAAAETDAAKDAIATAEELRKHFDSNAGESQDPKNQVESEVPTVLEIETAEKKDSNRNLYDSVANLPLEFYHYYHGSNSDMGTLIEVRRTWDAFLRTGGSRIPGNWVQPTPPSDDIWASYLVTNNVHGRK